MPDMAYTHIYVRPYIRPNRIIAPRIKNKNNGKLYTARAYIPEKAFRATRTKKKKKVRRKSERPRPDSHKYKRTGSAFNAGGLLLLFIIIPHKQNPTGRGLLSEFDSGRGDRTRVFVGNATLIATD